MQDGTNEEMTTGTEPPMPGGRRLFFTLWSVFAAFILILDAGAIVTRLAAGPQFDGLLMTAVAVSAAVLALRLLTKKPPVPACEPLKELFDSAGPMVASIGMNGTFTYVNPATERLLGYNASELVSLLSTANILAPGEGVRLVAEMEKMCGLHNPPQPTARGRLTAYITWAQTMPPSLVPSFEAQLCRKNGTRFPVTIYVSVLRDDSGAAAGLVVVAVDQSATVHQAQLLRESQERYRDLFENSSEMIATLSPTGQFLYANPAWKVCFGQDSRELQELESFEKLFGLSCRGEVETLFRRALEGETIDRAPLVHHTPDGQVRELELSLSRRQKEGCPLAMRCLLRDVTQQKRREHRLALQLAVSRIVGENPSFKEAATRILETLCVSQGWDVAIKWDVDIEENRLEFGSAWSITSQRAETLIQESIGIKLASGAGLPGQVWQEGRAVWIADLASAPSNRRVDAALRHEMVSGWAAPIRVDNKVLGVLEFYCHFNLCEDSEAMAAVETVAASLGQMMARSHEQGRAEGLYRQQKILLDSVADGICGVDRHGMVSFVNPAAAHLLGTSAADLTGKPVHELMHGAADASHQCGTECTLQRALEHHLAATGEDTIYRSNGSSFPTEYFLTPMLDQGRFSGSVLSFRDISQRYALDRLKDEFISTVSHELRTPLTSIRGALGLLSSGILGEVNEKATNLLRIAQTNSDRLIRLINDILDLERIQNGREPLTFRPVQLAEIVRQAIDGMQPVAEAANVQLLHDTTQVKIDADADRLLQVLTNLLSNAVKFSPPDSAISVVLRPEVNGVTLSVIDHGRGIPADKLENIFGRFQQVEASDSRQKGGSGLGLAICRTIVQQHCGRIWAEQNPTRGSTFHVFLPYKPVPAATPDKSGHGPSAAA
jgi:PAS domain S-box-containing protein